MEDSWRSLEAADGIRFSWNVWPNSRLEAAKCVLPLGVLYTPLRPLADLPCVPYDPVRCKGCVGVLNPYARVDYEGKIWICPFCHTRNHFPAHYAGVSAGALPAELYPSYGTLEYAPPRPPAPPPALLFVVDTVLEESEVGWVRAALQQALALLPEGARCGLITFGSHVHVHELGFPDCPRAHAFRGARDPAPAAVAEALGVPGGGGAGPAGAGPPGGGGGPRPGGGGGGGPPGSAAGGGGGGGGGASAAAAAAAARFLPRLSDAEFALTAALDDLQRSPFGTLPDARPARATGAALAVGAALLAACCPAGAPARLVLLVGGPATEGPGSVASKDLVDAVRSHKDVAKDAAPLHAPALRFYDALGARLAAQGHCLDVFASALDQVGLAEMRPAVERTGGVAVLAEAFAHDVFRASFARLLSCAPPPAGLALASCATVELACSRDVRCEGCLGPVASGGKPGAGCAEAQVGVGGTLAWKAPSLGPDTTLAFYFEPAQAGGGKEGKEAAAHGGGGGGHGGHHSQQQQQQQPGGGESQFYLQFITTYSAPGSGEWRVRVTTATRRWCDARGGADAAAAATPELAMGFDQEAAAALVARQLVWKMGCEEEFDPTRWLDRGLIRLCARFGDYRRDEPESFTLGPGFAIYPQFVFNLRRSQFVAVFNNSPDETAHFCMLLLRAPTAAALTMLQPSLVSYALGAPPEPALLDVASIQPDRVLLLDAFFSVVLFHGAQAAAWRRQGYAELPEHAAFAHLLAQPRADAGALAAARFPAPRFVDCDQGGSQARFLLARLNPSATHATGGAGDGGGGGGAGEIVFTDDVSLAVFMQHLARLATAAP